MEAAVHGMFKRAGEMIKRIYDNWGVGAFALPVLVLITLVGLAMTHMDVSNWMSEAAQAEFTGANNPPEPASKQLAQPAGEIRNVRSN
jgi:hypothetical protein